MSKATKFKHVVKEVDDLTTPTESQSIVRILDSRGNNLHEVEDSIGERYLVSMPTKFRRKIWVKRGNFVLVEPITEGDKVRAEIIKILTKEHQKWYRSQNCWPKEFDNTNNKSGGEMEADQEDDDLFVNTNRLPHGQEHHESDSDSDDSDSS